VSQNTRVTILRPSSRGSRGLRINADSFAAMVPAQFHNLGVEIAQQGHAPRNAGEPGLEAVVERQKAGDVVQEEPSQVTVRQPPEALVATIPQVQSLKQSPGVSVDHERLMTVGSKQQDAVGCFFPDPW